MRRARLVVVGVLLFLCAEPTLASVAVATSSSAQGQSVVGLGANAADAPASETNALVQAESTLGVVYLCSSPPKVLHGSVDESVANFYSNMDMRGLVTCNEGFNVTTVSDDITCRCSTQGGACEALPNACIEGSHVSWYSSVLSWLTVKGDPPLRDGVRSSGLWNIGMLVFFVSVLGWYNLGLFMERVVSQSEEVPNTISSGLQAALWQFLYALLLYAFGKDSTPSHCYKPRKLFNVMFGFLILLVLSASLLHHSQLGRATAENAMQDEMAQDQASNGEGGIKVLRLLAENSRNSKLWLWISSFFVLLCAALMQQAHC